MRTILDFGILLAAACALPACVGNPEPSADMVFRNGAVYTVDDDRSWSQAVAIRDGGIVYVGDDAGASAWVGAETRMVDLQGRMLMPGFHDAHTHVLLGGKGLLECSLFGLTDEDAIRVRLFECRNSRGYGENDWVIGSGWPITAFENGEPHKSVLDEVFGNRPAYFKDAFDHSAWVSSRALELAGINRDTPDPKGGVIVRDPDTGEPTGTLKDAALVLVADRIPEAPPEQRAEYLEAGLAEARRHGITAYIEPGLSAAGVTTYLEAEQRGALTARILASLSTLGSDSGVFDKDIFDLLARREEFIGEFFSANSVKVFVDGVIETHTSHMLEPYIDTGENFPPFYSQSELNDYYQKFDAMGIQIHTHAIGDGAVRVTLDAYQHAREQNGPTDNRHHITHLQLIDEADIPRFGEVGVAANFQGFWAWPDEYFEMAVGMVGEERANRFYAVASVQESAGIVIGGSDWNVTTLNPLDAMEALVRRQDPKAASGPSLGAGEAVDLATAIDMYTRNAAWVMKLDRVSGRVEVGKRADLVVLDRNLFEIPATEINEARVLLTLMDGRVVWEDGQR